MKRRTPLAEEYLAAGQQMEELHDGEKLREAAADVLAQLPPGPLVLLSASQSGAGLAATCAALRNQPTAWARVALTHHQALPTSGEVVFVEPTSTDVGWLHAVQRRYPDAIVVSPRSGLSQINAA